MYQAPGAGGQDITQALQGLRAQVGYNRKPRLPGAGLPAPNIGAVAQQNKPLIQGPGAAPGVAGPLEVDALPDLAGAMDATKAPTAPPPRPRTGISYPTLKTALAGGMSRAGGNTPLTASIGPDGQPVVGHASDMDATTISNEPPPSGPIMGDVTTQLAGFQGRAGNMQSLGPGRFGGAPPPNVLARRMGDAAGAGTGAGGTGDPRMAQLVARLQRLKERGRGRVGAVGGTMDWLPPVNAGAADFGVIDGRSFDY